ncbi:hypothetical protein T4A_9842 [Trichinella pseudospiralis]|nr:hypothetical protein T4A_9842 [Trichinella pseudospiralis]
MKGSVNCGTDQSTAACGAVIKWLAPCRQRVGNYSQPRSTNNWSIENRKTIKTKTRHGFKTACRRQHQLNKTALSDVNINSACAYKLKQQQQQQQQQ